MKDIYQLIPLFKISKQFISVWSGATKEVGTVPFVPRTMFTVTDHCNIHICIYSNIYICKKQFFIDVFQSATDKCCRCHMCSLSQYMFSLLIYFCEEIGVVFFRRGNYPGARAQEGPAKNSVYEDI